LVWNVLIDSNQNIKARCFGRFQQASVLQTSQIGETRGLAFVPGNRRRSRSSTHSSIRSFMRRVQVRVFGLPPAPPRLDCAERLETLLGSLPGSPRPPDIRTESVRALVFHGIRVRRASLRDL
jgi:hypothetical protein